MYPLTALRSRWKFDMQLSIPHLDLVFFFLPLFTPPPSPQADAQSAVWQLLRVVPAFSMGPVTTEGPQSLH